MLPMTPGAHREHLVTLLSTWGSLAAAEAQEPSRKVLCSCLFDSHMSVCPQAAELVSENCEAYEAHMRDIRDYLEERLEVSRTCHMGGILSGRVQAA